MATSPTLLPSFDPRRVPVTGVDDHLPAVPPDRLTPAALRQRFQAPPPWQPEVRQEPLFVDRAPVDAAVLVPLVLHDEGLSVLLTQRTDHLRSHAGQISFPGGRVEAEDASPQATALREAWEEIGLAPERVDVLGYLPDYRTGTGYRITPVVGRIALPIELRPDPREVAEAFEVPLAFLLDPANHREYEREYMGRMRRYFAMTYADRFIWGATAGIIVALAQVLNQGLETRA